MDLFFAAVLFIASTRLQLHAAWKSAYISFSVEKRMVTSNGSNIQLLTMLSAKPGKQKKNIYIRACLERGDLDSNPKDSVQI